MAHGREDEDDPQALRKTRTLRMQATVMKTAKVGEPHEGHAHEKTRLTPANSLIRWP